MLPPQTHRAREILQAIGRAYPSAWQQADRIQAYRGDDVLSDWPRWCYLPAHAAYAIVSGGAHKTVPFDRAHHILIVEALAAWRMGQQIIRFDTSLFKSLIDTPIAGDLPSELFYRLPSWCLYIETPGLDWKDRQIHGFFVHLDWVEGNRHELHILVDSEHSMDRVLDARYGLLPHMLMIGSGSVEDALERVALIAAQQLGEDGSSLGSTPRKKAELLSPLISSLLSLTLYLCSDSPDWGQEPPCNPLVVKTKRGLRTFPVAEPRVWDVGVRIGAALRSQATAFNCADPTGLHASPRPHLRRAHWHTYLTGSGRNNRVLKWLHPILVKTGTPEELPATIRSVKEREPSVEIISTGRAIEVG